MAADASPVPWPQAAAFAATVAVIVAGFATLQAAFAPRIERARLAWLDERIAGLLDAVRYDNDPLEDRLDIVAPELSGTDRPTPVYRARLRDAPVATILMPEAPGGYGGPLTLLVAISVDGTLLGVQVIGHRETAGIGDVYMAQPGWLDRFAGRSLARSPAAGSWRLRRDGGEIDAVSQASVTARAIVAALHRALLYHEGHRDALLAPAPAPPVTR